MLQHVCKVSEIRSDINKKRKQFLFRITWPLEDESGDDVATKPADADEKQKQNSKEQIRKKMHLSARRNKDLDAYSGGKVAALAVGGVVVGALTAGVGLVAGMVVVGIGAAASGGAAAITQNKGDKEKYLTLACDTYGDAERWIHAIENQIKEIGDALSDFPNNQPGCNFASENLRNVPPEIRLESVQKWLQQSRWKLKCCLNGTRLYENEVIKGENYVTDNTATIPQEPVPYLLRVNVPLQHSSPAEVFTTVMNMPPCCRTGVIRNYRIVESMDNQTDIIYMELEGMYMSPTYVYPRDLVLVRYWKHNADGSYVICLDSVEHRDCDLVPGVVRGLLHGVYVISPPKDIEKYDDHPSESLLTFIGQYDPRGWIWEQGGYKNRMLESFLLHVVDIRDAIDAERFTQIHFDVDYEKAVSGSAAGKIANGDLTDGNIEEDSDIPKSMKNTPPPTIPPEMWGEPDASTFRIRGKTYVQDKVKENSRPALFKLLACDLYETEGNIRNIASHPKNRVFQALQRGEDTWVFVVQIMVPGPPFYSYCAYFEGDKKLIEEDTPFGRVAHPFFNGNDEEYRNNRFKLIPKVVDGNMIVKMAVKDTPTLLGNKLKQYYYKGDNYFELDVDVGSSSVARNVVGLAMGYSKAIVVDMGFCLQGNDEDELPEVLMGASTVCHLDFSTAKKF